MLHDVFKVTAAEVVCCSLANVLGPIRNKNMKIDERPFTRR